MATTFSIADWARPQFPALARQLDEIAVTHLDGPAGSQVPVQVADAVRAYLLEHNANTHGAFATSWETDALIARLRSSLASFVGTEEPDEIVLGPNMTTLTLGLSRALLSTFAAGDELIVTALDHDANVMPWRRAAADHGVVVHTARVNPADATLDVDHLLSLLGKRTRLVAMTAASNLVGSSTPVAEVVAAAHRVGAEVFVDAVHYAPHRRIDVRAWNCDYLVASVYKFFGPHVAMMWGRSARLDELPVYQVRPALGPGPDRFSTGTQSLEGLAGAAAAIEYLASLGDAARAGAAPVGGAAPDLGARLDSAFAAIEAHESALTARLLAGLAALHEVRVVGITAPEHLDRRLPTVSLLHARHAPAVLAERLAARGIFCWSGNSYAWEVTHALGLEPEGVLRVGLLHYNTEDEVSWFLEQLASL